jgi:hypothetical protein
VPKGGYYDSEFVFGGQQGKEISTFEALNATLEMAYNDSAGNLVAFPTLYTFGSDTGEKATDLNVRISHGMALVTPGVINASLELISANPNFNTTTSTTTVETTTVNTTTVETTTIPNTYTSTPTSTSTVSASTPSTTYTASIQDNTIYYIIGAAVVVYIIVIVVAKLMHKSLPIWKHPKSSDNAELLRDLKMRYASGKISTKKYRQMKTDLKE